jgi:hypothetical protein
MQGVYRSQRRGSSFCGFMPIRDFSFYWSYLSLRSRFTKSLWARRYGVRKPVETNFSVLFQTSPEAHPTFCSVDKAAGVWRRLRPPPPPFSKAKVVNECSAQYLYSPCVPSGHIKCEFYLIWNINHLHVSYFSTEGKHQPLACRATAAHFVWSGSEWSSWPRKGR